MLELYLKLRIAAFAVGIGAALVLLIAWICVILREKFAKIKQKSKRKAR